MTQDAPRGEPDRTGPSPSTIFAAAMTLVCAATVSTLVRWSQWWPHSDLRQILANFLTVTAGIVGLVSVLFALNRLDRRRRYQLLGLTVVVIAVGLLLGFEVLQSVTADLR